MVVFISGGTITLIVIIILALIILSGHGISYVFEMLATHIPLVIGTYIGIIIITNIIVFYWQVRDEYGDFNIFAFIIHNFFDVLRHSVPISIIVDFINNPYTTNNGILAELFHVLGFLIFFIVSITTSSFTSLIANATLTKFDNDEKLISFGKTLLSNILVTGVYIGLVLLVNYIFHINPKAYHEWYR